MTLGLYNSYDPVRLAEAHRRAIARAAPIALAFDANLAAFGFPFEKDLRTPEDIAAWVSGTTSIGEAGKYLRELAHLGRFQTFEFPKRGFPPQLGEAIVTTSRPDPKKATNAASLARLPTRYGNFRIHAFVCPFTGEEHVALVKGNVAGKPDVLVRLHSECVTGDVFGSERCDCGQQLDAAMKRLGRAPQGVLLYLAQEGRGIGIVNKVAAYHLQDHGLDTVDANRVLGFPADLRSYKCAACMLRVLGVTSIQLMTNNPAKIEELRAYGVQVTKRIPLQVPATATNVRYLRSKKERLRHLLTTPTVRPARLTRRPDPP